MAKATRIDKVSYDLAGQVVIAITSGREPLPTVASEECLVFSDIQAAKDWADAVLANVPFEYLQATAVSEWVDKGAKIAGAAGTIARASVDSKQLGIGRS